MKAGLRKKRRSLRALERRIDPRVRVAGSVEMILLNLKVAGFEAGAGSPELNDARRRLSALLRTVRDLCRMAFWQSLIVPRTSKSRASGIILNQLIEMLTTARENLRSTAVTRADVLAAVDVLHEVVTSMNTVFTIGRISDQHQQNESWDVGRYICAVHLPTLAEQLGSFWVRLRHEQ